VTRPKRSLGQNFLIDPNLQRKIVEELGATPEDVVLEVGPGHGELSAHLVGRVARLVLIEKDRDLAADLAGRWQDEPGVEVVEADALQVDLSAWHVPGRDLRVLSNVPYNVTSPLLFAFLEIRPPPRRLVLTVQREVAERVVAKPGSRTYGALSVGVQAVAEAALAFPVSRRAFRPVPDVESAVLRIEPNPARIETIDTDRLRTLSRALFGRRRKQLQKILRTAPELDPPEDVRGFLERLGIDPSARPETLSPERIVALSEALEGG
jgi:16S rRNA (adenine1518-N6/adenine1519-N6)-dimethyltransferase